MVDTNGLTVLMMYGEDDHYMERVSFGLAMLMADAGIGKPATAEGREAIEGEWARRDHHRLMSQATV